MNCLDVLRALEREPESLEAFLTEVRLAEGESAHLDAAVREAKRQLADPAGREARARHLVERLALCLQGSLLTRHAPAEVGDAFCATRLGGAGGRAYGTLPAGIDAGAIVERHRPRLG